MSDCICKTTCRRPFLFSSTSNQWDYSGELVDILPPSGFDDDNYYLTPSGLLFQGENLVDSPSKFIFFDVSTEQIYQVTSNPHKIMPCRYSN